MRVKPLNLFLVLATLLLSVPFAICYAAPLLDVKQAKRSDPEQVGAPPTILRSRLSSTPLTRRLGKRARGGFIETVAQAPSDVQYETVLADFQQTIEDILNLPNDGHRWYTPERLGQQIGYIGNGRAFVPQPTRERAEIALRRLLAWQRIKSGDQGARRRN